MKPADFQLKGTPGGQLYPAYTFFSVPLGRQHSSQLGSYMNEWQFLVILLQESQVEMAAAWLPKSPNLICFVHVSVHYSILSHANLVTFTEEIFNGKLHFCAVSLKSQCIVYEQIRWGLSYYWTLNHVVHEQYCDCFTFLLFEILNFSFSLICIYILSISVMMRMHGLTTVVYGQGLGRYGNSKSLVVW